MVPCVVRATLEHTFLPKKMSATFFTFGGRGKNTSVHDVQEYIVVESHSQLAFFAHCLKKKTNCSSFQAFIMVHSLDIQRK